MAEVTMTIREQIKSGYYKGGMTYRIRIQPLSNQHDSGLPWVWECGRDGSWYRIRDGG